MKKIGVTVRAPPRDFSRDEGGDSSEINGKIVKSSRCTGKNIREERQCLNEHLSNIFRMHPYVSSFA